MLIILLTFETCCRHVAKRPQTVNSALPVRASEMECHEIAAPGLRVRLRLYMDLRKNSRVKTLATSLCNLPPERASAMPFNGKHF